VSTTPTATVGNLRARFTRAMETEYTQRVARYRAAGADPASAHQRALEEAKELGRQALEVLRQRRLFPRSLTGSESEPLAGGGHE
jgi:hypothetical protein